MKRFILLTFGVLGWAFYELSGGADFEPGTVSLASAFGPSAPSAPAEVVARSDTTAAELTAVAQSVLTPDTVDTSPRLDLALTSIRTVASPIRPDPEKAAVLTAPSPDDQAAIERALKVALGPQDVQDPSTAAPQDVAEDLREVSGNRVNLRNGPGTDYGIVTRLDRGDVVRVLEDPGNGWLRLKVVDSQRVGWMADFLVTASAN